MGPFGRFVTALVIAAAALPAFAHHGWSDYDGEKPMTLSGRIRTSVYENPHATIVLEVQGHSYTVVLAPVARMEGRGASRESVAVGREVTVLAYPSKTHPQELRAERITVREGAVDKTVELR